MENFYTSVKSFLFFAKLLGIFPMSFEGPARKGLLKVKWQNVFISFCLVLVTVSLFTMRFSFDLTFAKNSEILAKAWDIMTDVEILSYFLLFCYQIFKRKNILKFMKTIQSIDDEVESTKIAMRPL